MHTISDLFTLRIDSALSYNILLIITIIICKFVYIYNNTTAVVARA